MARVARRISKTGLYHIVFRGISRQNIFEESQDYEKMLKKIKKVKDEFEYNIYAYCLMSNHAHLFIKEKHERDIVKIMSKILSQYAGWFNRKYLRNGVLFGERYKSEAIEDERYLFSLVRYIHQNPRKAGMVDKLEDYKWSSYNEYINPNNNSLTDTLFILNRFSQETSKAIELFKEFHQKICNEDFEIANGRRKSENSIKRIIMSLINGEHHEEYCKEMISMEKNEIIKDLW